MTDERVQPVALPADWNDSQSRDIPLNMDPAGLKVVVTGLGVSGWACADVLAQRGAHVIAVDGSSSQVTTERAELLTALGGRALIGSAMPSDLPTFAGQPADVVVTSPGWAPTNPLLRQAKTSGIPVWGEIDVAWRLRGPGAAPWLCLTGTNGKTSTVYLLEAMLRADGRRAIACGNVGTPILDAIVSPDPFDVLAIELSSFQLHWSSWMAPLASAVLNVAPDHLDWHGTQDAYAADKGRIYHNVSTACVYNVADPVTEQLVRDADVVDGARAIGFTSAIPGPSQLGVVDDVLCDRAFGPDRHNCAVELLTIADVAAAHGGVAAPHHVSNVLAAAALGRAAGIAPRSVRDGVLGFTPEPHRIAVVPTADDITWVDDSKATNGHAAQASMAAFDHVVWIAGGLAKGANFDDLVRQHASRLRAVVVIGTDPEPIVSSMRRHASDVPVHRIDAPDTDGMTDQQRWDVGTDVMRRAVARSATLAQPGDTVLLAPACASMDQFQSYAARGKCFAEAVRGQVGQQS